jgi:glyoxylase-like metal-dependent hydrolase (beta-lactamase superfamily II)
MLALLFTMLSVFPAGKLYRTLPVADGIYAFVSPESNSPIVSGNVVAIAGDEGVLVVDSGRFPALARRMAAEIRRKTGKRVRYLVHTHWHLDHITGDAEFRAAFPGMTFLATNFTRRKILEKQRPYLRDLAKTDARYVDYLRQAIARGTRREGTPLTGPEKSYLRRETADIELEARELAGADPRVRRLLRAVGGGEGVPGGEGRGLGGVVAARLKSRRASASTATTIPG